MWARFASLSRNDPSACLRSVTSTAVSTNWMSSPSSNAKYIASLILFSLAALFVTWLTRSLVYARNQLDLKIHEINKTNEALQAEITERKRAEEALMRSKNYWPKRRS